ncbi:MULTISPECIES: hypothetical protein [Pontibacillus]|uniref:Uncharacterized protein n=1 Tax=Pontibacillus chungwhensis TaxID=265426 RepID=A0ABY8UZ93_9BACI|nr:MULTISPECIES: hypothetical protein [Pontibacillus]MCD5324241.1 hypothetical protein [Pontibacillus sp. HN14]WIF97704.1 hypothetical protein QNI29_18555 [Pontibacillus chungwhensis]
MAWDGEKDHADVENLANDDEKIINDVQKRERTSRNPTLTVFIQLSV